MKDSHNRETPEVKAALDSAQSMGICLPSREAAPELTYRANQNLEDRLLGLTSGTPNGGNASAD